MPCIHAGRECSVIYTIQPPPDLPCSPYVNISPGYSVILQCRVAVHKIFLSQKGGDVIKLQWHKKLTGSSSDLGSSEWIDSNNRQILQDDFVIYDAYLDLTNATMSKNYKYWCQVYGINSSDSFNYSTSTATVIRESAHYQYLPTCTQNEPLGWPVAKCALNGLDITLCECSSESKCRGLFGQLFFQKILGSRVLFYAPSAILIVLMLIIILVLIVVCIVCAFRCKRTSQKARKGKLS